MNPGTNGTNLPARNGQPQQQVQRTARDQFAAVVLAVASKELTTLFGSEQGKAAAARVALAFRAAASTAKDPDAFYSCSPESVASAMATSAFTQIMPGGPFCGCYLIPKRVNNVQTLNWWINHRGIKTLARRAGQAIEAMPYFAGDEVVIVRGRDWRVEVIEGDAPNRDDFGALLGFVYYVSDLETGALLAANKVSKAQIAKRRAKGQGGSVWNEWPMEMAEKTVIKYAAGRGDIFFDDVGNMALSRDMDAQEVVDTTATEVRTGAAALGGAAAAPLAIGTSGTDTPNYADEAARLAGEKVRAEAAAAEEEARRAQPVPGGLARFNDAVRNELGIDPETVSTFAGFAGIDLTAESDDSLIAFFKSISPGGARRKALDGFLGTLAKASGGARTSGPSDDGGSQADDDGGM